MVSDLRNYTEVLQDISVGNPVFLTKNGIGKYVLLDMEEYIKKQESIKLMAELAKGQKAGETSDQRSAEWESIESIESALGISPSGWSRKELIAASAAGGIQ